jgi:uridylate kinase
MLKYLLIHSIIYLIQLKEDFSMRAKYKRVLLKISGEALAGDAGFGLDEQTIAQISENIKKITDMGVQVSIVVGGGNIWRGRSGENMDRTRADHMGMLATAINALALCSALENCEVPTRVQTAIEMRQVAEPYIRGKAERHLEKGRVVIFGCGTGNPFMSTDTAAALRAVETQAEVILLAKKVDAVYDSDPNINPDAKKYDVLSFSDILSKNLGVMDSTAASMCRDNNMPILVFGLNDPVNIVRAVKGERIGTLVNNNGKL